MVREGWATRPNRTLQDLQVLGVVTNKAEQSPTDWVLSDWARALLEAAQAEAVLLKDKGPNSVR